MALHPIATRNVIALLLSLPHKERCAIIVAACAGDTASVYRIVLPYIAGKLREQLLQELRVGKGVGNRVRSSFREHLSKRLNVNIPVGLQQSVFRFRERAQPMAV